MLQHKPRKKCFRKLATRCHCLAPDSETAWVCCGWYCDTCGGNRNDCDRLPSRRS